MNKYPRFPRVAIRTKEEITAVVEVMKGNNPNVVEKFENLARKYYQVGLATTTNSGTGALFTMLKAYEIGDGDEVIVPAYTFITSITSIGATGALPVLADVDHNLVLSIKDVERKITKKTKGIMLVTFAGYPLNISEFIQLGKRYGLFIWIDNAQGIGGKYGGIPFGSLCNYGINAVTFSFQETKNIDGRQGGLIISSDSKNKKPFAALQPDVVHKLGMAGQNKTLLDMSASMLTSKITDEAAAVLINKLPRLHELTKKKNRIAQELVNTLRSVNIGIDPIWLSQGQIDRGDLHGAHLLPCWVNKKKLGISKWIFVERMDDKGVPISVSYDLNHPSIYSKPKDLPVSVKAAEDAFYFKKEAFTVDEIDYIIENAKSARTDKVQA